MAIKKAEFITSSGNISQIPEPKLPEYAFIGRSNVGKSSLINALTNKTQLAKVSSTPGKTQLINHFKIDNTWFLVDLPGYGYAKVGKKERDKFHLMIRSYLSQRSTLMCTFVLIDSRIPPQKIDLEFMQWMGEQGIPFVIVFTKIDKVKRATGLEKFLENYKNTLLETWEEMPQYFLTSSMTKAGLDEIESFIADINKQQG